jgi:YHS domain-containing protein
MRRCVMNIGRTLMMLVAVAMLAGLLFGDEKKEAETKPQTTCPIMGGKIVKSVYSDYEGKRIYFCCGGCPGTFEKDPAKYIKKLEDAGVTLEKVPTIVCGKCGEIKGAEKCCAKDAEKCAKCELNKGSAGCCKISSEGKDVELCAKCGAEKGSEKCCAKDAEKCPKCELNKGSAGCCKLLKSDGSSDEKDAKDAAAVCGMCGEVKGSEKCCK